MPALSVQNRTHAAASTSAPQRARHQRLEQPDEPDALGLGMTSADSRDDVDEEWDRPPVERDEWVDARLSVTLGTSRLCALQSTAGPHVGAR